MHNKNISYRPEVDGLRAMAVLPVILFHAGYGLFSGGFVGVDIFFVISGYLIASIILREMELKKFSIIQFYQRRARRLLPALLFILLITLIVSWCIMTPDDFRRVGQSMMGISGFVQNFYFKNSWGYFESWKTPPLYLHTWSLAVEEQFYVFFPICLILLLRFGRLYQFLFVAFIACLSILAANWGWRHDPEANFYLLPTRAWELMAGSMLAFIPAKFAFDMRRGNISQVFAMLGFALLVYSIFVFDEKTPWPSFYTLIPIAGSVLIIGFSSEKNVVGKLLSSKWLVGIGIISYSAYLWHHPLFVLAEYRFSYLDIKPLLTLVAIALTFMFAWGTYYFIEKPFRLIIITTTRVLALSFCGLFLVFLVGLLLHKNIISSRAIYQNFGMEHVLERDDLPNGLRVAVDCAGKDSTHSCRIISTSSENEKRRKFFVFGDSFAADLLSEINKSIEKNSVGASLTAAITYACPYVPSGFNTWNGECGKARDNIDNLNRNDFTDVIFSVNFTEHLGKLSKEDITRDLNSYNELFQRILDKGIKVYVIAARPVFQNLEPTKAKIFDVMSVLREKSPPEELYKAYTNWSAIGVCVLKKSDISEQPFTPELMYIDRGHFSPQGARIWLELIGLNSEIQSNKCLSGAR
jgi:peptidoglycan/LPS O-acetylase OafA/YrhL